MDPEIKAMSDITEVFKGLDSDAIVRVLRWATQRYNVPGTPIGKDAPIGEVSPTPSFSEFHELFDAANPSTGPLKALVISYWRQVVCGDETLDSQALNKELKDLGHPSTNITRDLDSLINRAPRLVMQVKKGGSTKQARKKYRVTQEGIKMVEGMLNATTA